MKAFFILLIVMLNNYAHGAQNTAKTENDQPRIEMLGHASVVVYRGDLVIYVDPCTAQADFGPRPKADLILVTHEHYDHLDSAAIATLATPETIIIATAKAREILEKGNPSLKVRVLGNGESMDYEGANIIATAAYNIRNIRPETGLPYHPKGAGNGYIIEFPGCRLYVAGDTELIPEMSKLGEIDIAFMPKMLPFTMADNEFIEAAKIVNPKVLYPYHYKELDRDKLQQALPEIEIR